MNIYRVDFYANYIADEDHELMVVAEDFSEAEVLANNYSINQYSLKVRNIELIGVQNNAEEQVFEVWK